MSRGRKKTIDVEIHANRLNRERIGKSNDIESMCMTCQL